MWEERERNMRTRTMNGAKNPDIHIGNMYLLCTHSIRTNRPFGQEVVDLQPRINLCDAKGSQKKAQDKATHTSRPIGRPKASLVPARSLTRWRAEMTGRRAMGLLAVFTKNLYSASIILVGDGSH